MHISKDKTDRLFAEKLENHTVKPRAEAWEKLDGKLQQKKRKIMPIWQRMGIAASVLILLFAGGVTYFKNRDKVAENQTVAANINPSKSAEIAVNNTEKVNLLEEKKEIIEKISPATKIEKQDKPAILFANNITPFAQERSIEVQKMESKTPNFEKPDLSNNELIAENNLPKAIDKEEVVTEKPEDLTIVFTVANFDDKNSTAKTQEEKYENEKKPKYLTRFFKQIINAKNGDRVDWNEVGFKPAKILARAENKLKSTKEELNGSYQTVKNKTVL
jgi:hypothetical protein